MKKLEWQFSTGIAGGIVFSLGIPGKNGMVGKIGVTRLRSIKLFSVQIISLWDICNNIQVGAESYPWAIRNIQDGCRKTGQICDGDVHFW